MLRKSEFLVQKIAKTKAGDRNVPGVLEEGQGGPCGRSDVRDGGRIKKR